MKGDTRAIGLCESRDPLTFKDSSRVRCVGLQDI